MITLEPGDCTDVMLEMAAAGTTLQAAGECGFNAVGIERDPEYQADIMARLAAHSERQAKELLDLCA